MNHPDFFVALNLDVTFAEKPPWLDAAAQAAAPSGGLKKVLSIRSGTSPPGGSNSMPILLGPGGFPGLPNYDSWNGYGWVRSSWNYSTCATWVDLISCRLINAMRFYELLSCYQTTLFGRI